MHLRDYVDPSLIFTGLEPEHKASLLSELAALTAQQIPELEQQALLDRLVEREKESSTGVGAGVAIPHCFLDGLEQSRCVLVQVPKGVEYDAIDDQPVHILFMLLSPPDARMTHLRLLARISRVANRDDFAVDACAAPSAEALHELILREDRAHSG